MPIKPELQLRWIRRFKNTVSKRSQKLTSLELVGINAKNPSNESGSLPNPIKKENLQHDSATNFALQNIADFGHKASAIQKGLETHQKALKGDDWSRS
jgi:hypothetical protein